MPICCRWLCVCWLQVDDQRIAGTEELEKSEESERLAAGVVAAGRRHTDRTQSTRLGDHQMGVCASKADELSHENKAQCSPAKRSVVTLDSSRDMSVGFKTLSCDSPGSSAEVGDIGKLGTLLCSSSSRRPQTDQEAGFSESHHEMLQRRLSGSLGEISFTSYLSSPLIREFDFHGFDAIAKSYVESAGKAAARDTFMFLKENDRALGTRSSIEQLSSDRMIHRFPLLDNSSLLDYTDQGVEAHNTLERSLDINAADAAVVQQQLQAAGHEFRLHASRPGSVVDEKEVVKTQKLLGAADNYYSQPDQTDLVIDFGVSLKPELVTSSPRPRPRLSSSSSSVEDHKSLFDACFPATSRWASVVNAARQSACLPTRPLIRLPNQSVITDKRKEAFAAAAAAAAREMQLLQCPGTIFESTIRSSSAITQTAAVSTPASIQERVMGCCGSGEKGLHLLQWDAKHQCASSARTMSESSACGSQQTQANSLKLRSSHQCHAIFSTIDHDVNMLPSSTTTGEDLPEGQGCLACFSLANGLRMINLPSTGKLESMSNSCSSIMLRSSSSNSKARANCQAGGSDQQLDHHDPDTDAFFSFPSSPSAAHVDEVMIADSAATYRKKNSIQPPVECGFKDCIEPSRGFKSAQPFTTQLQAARQQALGLKNHATVVPAFSKGAAFGSPFPVRCATTTQCSCSSLSKAQQKLQQPDHFVDKNLELFSLEQACTLTLAWNSVAMDSQRSSSAITTEPESLDSPETSSSNQDLGFRDVHDTDDSSSDLFEIGNIQGTSTIMGFNRLDFPHLEPIKSTSLNTAPRQVSEISSGHCMSATPTNPGSIRNSSQRGAKAVHVANMRANSLKEQAQEKEKNAELVKEAISSCYAAAAAAAGNSGQQGQGIVLMKLGLLKQKHPASKNGTAEKWHYPSSQGNKISLPIIDSENKPTPFGTTTSEAAPVTLAGQ